MHGLPLHRHRVLGFDRVTVLSLLHAALPPASCAAFASHSRPRASASGDAATGLHLGGRRRNREIDALDRLAERIERAVEILLLADDHGHQLVGVDLALRGLERRAARSRRGAPSGRSAGSRTGSRPARSTRRGTAPARGARSGTPASSPPTAWRWCSSASVNGACVTPLHFLAQQVERHHGGLALGERVGHERRGPAVVAARERTGRVGQAALRADAG